MSILKLDYADNCDLNNYKFNFIVSVSKKCGMLNSGALLLEEKLTRHYNNTEPPPLKKCKISVVTSNKTIWAQLAQ